MTEGRSHISHRLSRWSLNATVVAICFVSVAPVLVILIGSFGNETAIRFPPETLGFEQYRLMVGDSAFWEAFAFSLGLALVVALLSGAAGTLAAIAITRYASGRMRFAVTGLVLLPLVVPSIIMGVSILQTFVSAGLPSAPWGLLVGHVVTSLPFMFAFAVAALAGFPSRLGDASRNLGAGPLRTFWSITVPVVAPGIIAGLFFSFIHSFDETDMSLFLTRRGWVTLPVKIFRDTYEQAPTAGAESGVMVAVAVIVFLILEWRYGLLRLLLSRGGTKE